MPAENAITQQEAYTALIAPVTRVYSRVEIFQQNGETEWATDIPLIEGTVNVTDGDTIRRSLDVVLDYHPGEELSNGKTLDNYPGNFWYDKVVKAFRGIETDDGTWEAQVGEFMIDSISTAHFPHQMSVQGRDYGKKLELSKFDTDTLYAATTPIETAIQQIAANARVTKFSLPVNTGITVGADALYERGSSRAEAVNEIATANGYDVYFDANGVMRMQEHQDPVTSPRALTLVTGEGIGNLISYTKSANDSEIFNHVLCVGGVPKDENGKDITDAPPVWGRALNKDPDSPTRISELGDRFYQFENPLVRTVEKAEKRAAEMLSVRALESFELSFTSLVIPWLEVGEIVEFIDPNPNPGDPTSFLLSSFSIPLGLGSMSGIGRRITVVG